MANMVSHTFTQAMADTMDANLEGLVDNIIKKSFDPVPEFTGVYFPGFDMMAKLKRWVEYRNSTLPPARHITEFDARGILELTYKTEVPTDEYANVDYQALKEFPMPNQRRYINVWKQDETTHRVPLEAIVSHMYTEAEMQRIKWNTESKKYAHPLDINPQGLNVYHAEQEMLTFRWYKFGREKVLNAARDFYIELAEKEPENREDHRLTAHIFDEMSKSIMPVSGREAAHKVYFRDMAHTGYTTNPLMMYAAIKTITHMMMPGKILFPELQEKVPEWMEKLDPGRFEETRKEGTRLVADIIEGDDLWMGRLVRDHILENKVPAYLRGIIKSAVKIADRLGIPYTHHDPQGRFEERRVIGEVLLSKVMGKVAMIWSGYNPKQAQAKA